MESRTILILFETVNFAMCGTLLVVIEHYMRNASKNRRRFWITIAALFTLLSVVGILNALLHFPRGFNVAFFRVWFSSVVLFFILYINKTYGHKAIIKRQLARKQMEIYSKFLPFNISPISDLVGDNNKGYIFDIDAFLDGASHRWKQLTPDIKYRKYKGDLKFDASYAIECEISDKGCSFPIQCHKYTETFEVLKGRVEVKAGLFSTPDIKPMQVIEGDMHYYKCSPKTRHISYFTKVSK